MRLKMLRIKVTPMHIFFFKFRKAYTDGTETLYIF